MNRNNAFLVILIFVLAGLSQSCQMRNRYVSPGFEPDGLFRGEFPLDTTTIADIPWEVYFTDTVLLNLISEGLSYNYDVRVSYARIAQAEATLKAARAALFPSVNAGGGVTHTRVSNGKRGKDVFGYSSTQYTLAAAVSWEADIWGRLSNTSRAQYAAYLSSYAYRNLIMTSVIANVANYYYTLLALDRQLQITQETVDLLDETVETMQALMDAGIQNGAAVQQSKALYFSTLVTIPDLEYQIESTENALCVLLGRVPGPIERTTLAEQDDTPILYHGVPAQMLAKRPDVAQAELAVRQAFHLTAAAQAAFYPTISLGSGAGEGSSIGWTSTTLSNFFRPENLVANIVGGIAQPVFNKRQIRSNYEAAMAQQTEALLTFEKTALSAAQEVSDLIFGYISSLDKNPLRDLQIEALETSVYFTGELLIAGEANYTEVLTARQNLLSAQLSQVSDKLEQLQYSVNLYRALGGGY